MAVLRWAHILGGGLALGALWVPLVSRKGGALHRGAGWVYAVAMWVAALAAFGMCAVRLTDGDDSNDAAAWLLAFLGLLAANGAATGIRVLRTRRRVAPRASSLDLASSALLLVAALALGAYGVRRSSSLHVAFCVLGVFLGGRQLRYWLGPAATDKDWWFTHMANMLAACIGTVTAFVVVNLPRFGLQGYARSAFFLPGILGGVATTIWIEHYRRKFAGRTPRPRAAGIPPAA